MVSFENFVKSMLPSLSELKVTPSFCFPFKIPDHPTATKHGRLKVHPLLSQSGLNWGSIYFCRKNDVICYVIERKVVSFFLQKKTPKKLWCQIDFGGFHRVLDTSWFHLWSSLIILTWNIYNHTMLRLDATPQKRWIGFDIKFKKFSIK